MLLRSVCIRAYNTSPMKYKHKNDNVLNWKRFHKVSISVCVLFFFLANNGAEEEDDDEDEEKKHDWWAFIIRFGQWRIIILDKFLNITAFIVKPSRLYSSLWLALHYGSCFDCMIMPRVLHT